MCCSLLFIDESISSIIILLILLIDQYINYLFILISISSQVHPISIIV